MKTLINEYKKIYKYNCDRCNKEISFNDNTLRQVYIKFNTNKSKKICDLCDKCYRAFYRATFKKK